MLINSSATVFEPLDHYQDVIFKGFLFYSQQIIFYNYLVAFYGCWCYYKSFTVKPSKMLIRIMHHLVTAAMWVCWGLFLLFSFLADFLISYHIINLFSNSFQTDSDSVLHFGGHQLTSQDETIEENVTFKSGTIDDETMLHYEQTKKFVNIYHFVTRNFQNC